MISSLHIFKKRKSYEGLKVDIHSHLIPDIDDGAKDMEESLLLLRALENLGYTKVITTPHIMLDTYCNTKEIIEEGLKHLQASAKEQGIGLVIEAAAEYYMDEGLFDHLESGEMLTFGDDYLLFETSYVAEPLYFDELVYEMIAKGYKPVLAHPERYRYLYDYEERYRKWKDQGIYFQVNLNSFGGHYAKDAKIKAEFLADSGMIDFLGSDVHHMKQVETLGRIMQKKVYFSLFRNNQIMNNRL